MLRDVIWTIIIVWLIIKLVDIFKGSSKKSFAGNSTAQQGQNQQNHSHTSYTAKKDTKEAIQKSADKEGDYIDFEEIK